MKYRLLVPAVADLRHIENWVATEFGEASAQNARRKLLDAFALLAQIQELGKLRPEIAASPVRFYVQPPNWIVYRPGDPLLIHRIFPARMGLDSLEL